MVVRTGLPLTAALKLLNKGLQPSSKIGCDMAILSVKAETETRITKRYGNPDEKYEVLMVTVVGKNGKECYYEHDLGQGRLQYGNDDTAILNAFNEAFRGACRLLKD